MTQDKKVAKAVYIFADDAGAQGDITLAQTETIPAGAVVTDVYWNERTAVTVSAGTADVDVQVGSSSQKLVEGIVTTSISGLTHVFEAHAADATDAAVDPVSITTTGTIQLHNDTSSSGTLTAGVVDIWVEYFLA